MTYSHLSSHSSMVFDETRNRAYLQAIRAHVTPESVVLDLGAGLGVLGLLAAKAGAKHVYCVEPAPVAGHIKALAEANGIADRVTVIRSRIEEVELPEQVDLMVSVFTGNMLFTEGLLPSLYHARDRYLKPGGVMVPDRGKLMLKGVDAKDLYRKRIERFREPSIGIDYSSLVEVASNAQIWMSREMPEPASMTETLEAIHLDFQHTHAEGVTFEADAQVIRDGAINAILGWIEIRLGDTWLSTAPGQPDVHWSPALLPLAKPFQVQEGARVSIGYRFVDESQVFWSLRKDGVRQQQATVMGNRSVLMELMLSSPDCSNALGEDGLIAARILSMMQRGDSNRAIAQDLGRAFPARYPDERIALKAVGRLAARYRNHPARHA